MTTLPVLLEASLPVLHVLQKMQHCQTGHALLGLPDADLSIPPKTLHEGTSALLWIQHGTGFARGASHTGQWGNSFPSHSCVKLVAHVSCQTGSKASTNRGLKLAWINSV